MLKDSISHFGEVTQRFAPTPIVAEAHCSSERTARAKVTNVSMKTSKFDTIPRQFGFFPHR